MIICGVKRNDNLSVCLMVDTESSAVAVVVTELQSSSSVVDQTTRQFNFWTHQMHNFFVRKFLPAAQLLLAIRQRLQSETFAES